VTDRSPRRVDSSVLLPEQPALHRGELVAIGGLVVAFGLAAGLAGLGVALATIAIWYRAGTPYAIAAGHVLLVALAPEAFDIVSIVLVETAMIGLAIAPATWADWPVRIDLPTVVATLLLATVAILALRYQPLWIAGLLTVGALALASYALYRYSLVALDLIDDSEPTP